VRGQTFNVQRSTSNAQHPSSHEAYTAVAMRMAGTSWAGQS
jgi:hypothetical protein